MTTTTKQPMTTTPTLEELLDAVMPRDDAASQPGCGAAERLAYLDKALDVVTKVYSFPAASSLMPWVSTDMTTIQAKRQAWNRHKFQTFCLRLHQHSVPRTRLIASVRLARGWRCRKTLVIVRDMQQAVQATWKRLANDDADKLA